MASAATAKTLQRLLRERDDLQQRASALERDIANEGTESIALEGRVAAAAAVGDELKVRLCLARLLLHRIAKERRSAEAKTTSSHRAGVAAGVARAQVTAQLDKLRVKRDARAVEATTMRTITALSQRACPEVDDSHVDRSAALRLQSRIHHTQHEVTSMKMRDDVVSALIRDALVPTSTSPTRRTQASAP